MSELGDYASDFHIGIKVGNGGSVVSAYAKNGTKDDDGEDRWLFQTFICNSTEALASLVVRLVKEREGPDRDVFAGDGGTPPCDLAGMQE